uniref:tRNA-guanine(15) transglycosylase-like domain-containing protein n=1 Tax=Malurus cyaneus samueli TaxID=2593467 RepID=A0A8C5UDD3_9PASS
MTQRDVPGFAIGVQGWILRRGPRFFWGSWVFWDPRIDLGGPRVFLGVPGMVLGVPGCFWGPRMVLGSQDDFGGLPSPVHSHTRGMYPDLPSGSSLGGGSPQSPPGLGRPRSHPQFRPSPVTPPIWWFAVALGCDMFDCVFPTRTAVRGVGGGNLGTPGPFFKVWRPPNPLPSAAVVSSYSRAYLHALLRCNTGRAWHLLTLHNIAYQVRFVGFFGVLGDFLDFGVWGAGRPGRCPGDPQVPGKPQPGPPQGRLERRQGPG